MNTVQVNFINGAARPHMEEIIKAIHILDTFAADYEAIQGSADAIPEDATVLDDNASGDAPRLDAPQLTGAQVKTLNDLSVSMSAVVSAAVKTILVSKMVRPLATVLKV